MTEPIDGLARLEPALRRGERVSLLLGGADGAREVIGFVTHLDDHRVDVVDRRGHEHAIARGEVEAARRVAVALGRRPRATPTALLDALAERAGTSGRTWVARISDLLAGRTPPETVPPWGEWAEIDGVRARFEGEWVTLPDAPPDTIVAAAWWATRMGARSVQVRVDAEGSAPRLVALGFEALP